MMSAWYGVISSGNQADAAINKLAQDAPEEFWLVKEILIECRYVDDVNGGTNTEEEREQLIEQMTYVLSLGGFDLKYVVRSGHKPCEKASADGVTMKVLGYTWAPERDVLSPGYPGMNFNPKQRGAKKHTDVPAETMEDIQKLIMARKVTKRDVLSRMSEMYDPCGIWEPFRVQMKLAMIPLNGIDWDATLSEDLRSRWAQLLANFAEVKSLEVPRAVIPVHADPSSLRLICVADAAEHCAGAAIYVGYENPDGTYTCWLLTSKSKIVISTIPRNELSAILLMAELAYIVNSTAPIKPREIIYTTDSMIALSWCSNGDKKLRQFVLARVQTIRRLMEWTIEDMTTLPLYPVKS